MANRKRKKRSRNTRARADSARARVGRAICIAKRDEALRRLAGAVADRRHAFVVGRATGVVRAERSADVLIAELRRVLPCAVRTLLAGRTRTTIGKQGARAGVRTIFARFAFDR